MLLPYMVLTVGVMMYDPQGGVVPVVDVTATWYGDIG